MTSSSISLVPSDLLIRVVKYFKSSGDARLLLALTATSKLPAPGPDRDQVRRLLVIFFLPPDLLTDREKIWLLEMDKARKTLLGVWQGRVSAEAVAAQVIIIALSPVRPVSSDLARLAAVSLHERYGAGLFWQWCVRLLSPLITNSSSESLPGTPTVSRPG